MCPFLACREHFLSTRRALLPTTPTLIKIKVHQTFLVRSRYTQKLKQLTFQEVENMRQPTFSGEDCSLKTPPAPHPLLELTCLSASD